MGLGKGQDREREGIGGSRERLDGGVGVRYQQGGRERPWWWGLGWQRWRCNEEGRKG